MKAPAFRYLRAETRAAAVALLAEHGGNARVLAGGQSLMAMMNLRLADPGILIDINPIAELAAIEERGSVLRIGAMARHRDVANSPLVRRHLPLLPRAIEHVAHAAIRNRGTHGGSIALADPAAEMPACALALDATMVVAGRSGERRIAADDFFRGLFETAMKPDELLVAVDYPIAPPWTCHAIEEVARRRGDYALVGAVAAGRPGALRIVLFGVADRPVRAVAAERAHAAGGSAAEAVETDFTPASDMNASAAMRRHLARVVVGRLLAQIGTRP